MLARQQLQRILVQWITPCPPCRDSVGAVNATTGSSPAVASASLYSSALPLGVAKPFGKRKIRAIAIARNVQRHRVLALQRLARDALQKLMARLAPIDVSASSISSSSEARRHPSSRPIRAASRRNTSALLHASPSGSIACIGELQMKMSVRGHQILLLQKGRRRQNNVRIVGRVGEELLVHHGKQIACASTPPPPGCGWGRPPPGFDAYTNKAFTGGVSVGIASAACPAAFMLRMRAPDGPAPSVISSGRCSACLVERERARSRERQPAALLLPCAGDRRQHGDGAHRHPSVFATAARRSSAG